MNNELLENINLLHTTQMGIERIQKNLQITDDVVEFCKKMILDKNCKIYRQGKNWYCEGNGIKITINAYSYTIITAHKIQKNSKFLSLWCYIKNTHQNALSLTFKEIEDILGFPIDHSFLKYKNELQDYGYEVKKISMKEEYILFEKK